MTLRLLPIALTLAVMTGCASTPPSTSSAAATAWAVDSDVTFTGRVTAVDASPWTYDGNARVTLASDGHGAVALELPARWNLCQARGIERAAQLPVGTRVRVTARVQDAGTVVACASPTHAITQIP